jgi:hypothetical protein
MSLSVEENIGDAVRPESKEDSKLRFKMKVQVEVMKKLGYFSDPSYIKELDPDKRRMMEGDIFMKWVTDNSTNVFRECFNDIVKDDVEYGNDDVGHIVNAVLAEMSMRQKH